MFVSAHVSDALENESKDTENHYQSTFDYIIYAQKFVSASDILSRECLHKRNYAIKRELHVL